MSSIFAQHILLDMMGSLHLLISVKVLYNHFSSFCFYNFNINYLKLLTSCNLTELFIIITELGDYEYHVWYLRFVSALLGSLVVPMVYEVGGKML